MKLVKFSYSEPGWEIKDLELNDLNLIVGKNAVGKSRTLSLIDSLTLQIAVHLTSISDQKWEVELLNDQDKCITYCCEMRNQDDLLNIFEELTVDGQLEMKRTPNQASLKNHLSQQFEIVHTDPTKLTLHEHRDIAKYPYFEDLIYWAETQYEIRFSEISPSAWWQRQHHMFPDSRTLPSYYAELTAESSERIKTQMNQVGFKISKIELQKFPRTVKEDSSLYIKGEQEDIVLFLKEDGISEMFLHVKASQGMFRTLSILIFLEYLISKKISSLILIDDFCEGLDYERARKLGALVFKLCQGSPIQLIATSNDSFLMDAVDIKHWNVLQREGKTITSINYKNNQKLFDDFKFTGLSNFDFFSSNYLQKAEK